MNPATLEQFESMVHFLKLLSKLGLKSANSVANDYYEDNSGDWELCDDCTEVRNECRCSHHDYWDGGREFDDESSFE